MYIVLRRNKIDRFGIIVNLLTDIAFFDLVFSDYEVMLLDHVDDHLVKSLMVILFCSGTLFVRALVCFPPAP